VRITKDDFSKSLNNIKDEAESLSKAVRSRYQKSKTTKEKK